MMSLTAKELRQLLPIWYLWLAVLVLGYATQFAVERFDEQTFGAWCNAYCDISPSATVVMIAVMFSLITAYSLFPREHDDSTIDFLRALPLSRWSIYVAKVLAAVMLLWVLNLLSYGFDALMLSTNPESISGRFYPQVWGSLLLRDVLFAVIIVSHGVVLSWFRTIGLVIYALYLLLLMVLETRGVPVGVFSVFSIYTNEYDGSTLNLDWRAISVHLVVAVVLYIIGYRLWSRTESSRSGGKSSSRMSAVWRGLLSVAGFLFLGMVMFYQVGLQSGGMPQDDLRVEATEHYRFVYHADKQATVDYMLEHAEDDLAALADILGVTELPVIRVDLSAASEHAAGLAKWKKIQMDLDAFTDDRSQRRVLSHETVHVVQAIESNRTLGKNFSAVRFFVEGMAQYVSFEVVPEEERRETNWAVAAVTHDRNNIGFNQLINDKGFSQRYDAELYYSLGDLWTAAMVDECGEESLGNFLRATGREDADEDMGALIFWRDTMQTIGCELDAVNVRWAERMDEVLRDVDQSRFPVWGDVVISRDKDTGRVELQASLKPANQTSPSGENDAVDGADGADGADGVDGEKGAVDDDDLSAPSATEIAAGEGPTGFVLRVQVDAQLGGSVPSVFRGWVDGEGDARRVVFSVPENVIPRTRFRYQLGFAPSDDSRYYYETWRSGSAPQR